MTTRWLLLGAALGLSSVTAGAADWPQWRGPNRDNKVTGFAVPAAWPKALTRKWKTEVGDGVASPVLAGGKVYVFTRQGGDEVTRCLDASTGKELWQDKYPAPSVNGPDRGYQGPRSTPEVADGKVLTFGVAGTLSCLDAETGKVVWRKDTKSWPRFHTSASPIVVDGLCVIHLGTDREGALTAFDLATGAEKWKWAGDGPGYASPVLMTVGGTKQVVTLTANNVVGVATADGKLLWQVPFKARYNTVTPIVDGDVVIYGGAPTGTVALQVQKEGDRFTTKELWKKKDSPHQYNTPVLKDGLLYGLSPRRNFYCMSAKTGDVLWTDTASRGECGTILDAGPVLLALTSDSNLVAFRPSDKGYEELAKIKVADSPTWACPILAGNRVFVKDRDSVILWTVD